MSIVRASLKGLQAPSPISDVPDAPTIGTVTASNAIVSVPFTPATTGGVATSYLVTANPSVADISTNAGTSSPRTVTGTFVGNSSYTFTIKAVNSTGSSSSSTNSNSLIVSQPYSLSQTFTANGTYTVPNGISKLAVYVQGAGASGGTGATDVGQSLRGGVGGRGGTLALFEELTVTPGTNYSVTIGASGSSTSFGSLLIVTSSSGQSTAGSVSGSASGITSVSGGIGGNFGTNGASFGQTQSGGGGSNGSNGGTLTGVSVGLITYQSGGGGGGGGAGASGYTDYNSGIQAYGGGGGNGGLTGGGQGGTGGNVRWDSQQQGSTGSSGSDGGGGGGGGGPSRLDAAHSGFSKAGGSGGSGKVYVYAKA